MAALSDIRHEKFAQSYALKSNGVQAMYDSGFTGTYGSANTEAYRLLQNVAVTTRIAELKAEIAKQVEKKFNLTKDQLLERYRQIGFGDLRKMYNADGTMKKIADLDDDTAASLAGHEVEDLYEGSGEFRTKIGHTIKVKQWNPVPALDGIARITGWNAPVKTENKNTEVPQYDLSCLTDDELELYMQITRKLELHNTVLPEYDGSDL